MFVSLSYLDRKDVFPLCCDYLRNVGHCPSVERLAQNIVCVGNDLCYMLVVASDTLEKIGYCK